MDPKLDPVPPKQEAKRTRARAKKLTEAELTTKLEDDLAGMGALWSLMDPVCGTLVARRAPVVASAWARLAMDNDRVYKMVTRMGTSSGWAAALISTGGLVLGIAAHHGLAPEGLAGIAVPEYAEIVAQVKATEATWPEQGPPPPKPETESKESDGNKDNTQP